MIDCFVNDSVGGSILSLMRGKEQLPKDLETIQFLLIVSISPNLQGPLCEITNEGENLGVVGRARELHDTIIKEINLLRRDALEEIDNGFKHDNLQTFMKVAGIPDRLEHLITQIPLLGNELDDLGALFEGFGVS